PGQREGLRDEPRPVRPHARRVRRLARHDGRARERRGALAWRARRHVPLVGRDRRPRRAEHAPPPGRRPRLRNRRHGLHPRARRRPVAPTRRHRRARGRRDRRAPKPRRPAFLTLASGETHEVPCGTWRRSRSETFLPSSTASSRPEPPRLPRLKTPPCRPDSARPRFALIEPEALESLAILRACPSTSA